MSGMYQEHMLTMIRKSLYLYIFNSTRIGDDNFHVSFGITHFQFVYC